MLKRDAKTRRCIQVGGLLSVLLLLPSCRDEQAVEADVDKAPIFNFHTIAEGEAYRSAQPSGDELIEAVERYGIRTVINLRGENPDKDWYVQEVEAIEKAGITLIDHSMSSKRLPDPEMLRAITESLQSAEYPILIHCQSGSDRSGAVTAIYRMLVLGHDRKEALEELSMRYFHYRKIAPCMDTLAEWYEPGDEWLDQYAEEYQQVECE